MRAKPLKFDGTNIYMPCEPQDATHVTLNFPGPVGTLILPVILKGTREGTNCWSWNGDVDKPTLKPSIKTNGGTYLCHTFVNDGKVIFLDDCTHEFKGQTLDMLEIEEHNE